MDPIVTVPEIMVRQAQKYGRRTYLFYGDEEISYAQMAERGFKVAHGLRSAGIERGEPVAVMVYNGPHFFDLLFGLAAAGTVLVPINTRYKEYEIEYILKHTEAGTLIVDSELWPNIAPIRDGLPSLKRIFIEGEDLPPGTRPLADLYVEKGPALPEVRLDDDIAVIYTSGTTGRPKGVLLTHGNYVVNAFQGGRGKDFNETTRVLTCLPLVHVNAQVSSFLGSFVLGGQLVLQEEFHPQEFLAGLSRYHATIFAAVPTIYAILLNQPNLGHYDLSHLTYCISGSAPMSKALLEEFERVFKANILEAYGLTEATAMVSTNPPCGVRKVGSIGLPYEGIRIRVVDGESRILDDYKVGEIVVAGPNVMKGYYNDPDATASAIVDGWLHTGDLGYRDVDGYFFLSGRIKEMIIRGGINIYPKEIEEVIQIHPKVSQVAVVGIEDEVWGERIHACVIPKSGHELTYDELKDFLKEKIADFKVPSTLSIHDTFPQTGPGKIQKGKLVEVVIQSEERR